MESINPDDIEDIDPKQISIITLKNGNIIAIDDTIPSKKQKNNKDKNTPHNNYQISQKLINLTIINKKEKQKELNDNPINFNSKINICQNISLTLGNNTKEQNKNILYDNFKYNDIGKNKKFSFKSNLLGNNNNNNIDNKQNLKTESNKDEKEIERIKEVDMDIDSKSKYEYKALINEFDYNTKNKIKLESKFHNINNLLNSKVFVKESTNFDFANHLNTLVNNFKNKIKDLKRDNHNKRYYEIYKGIKNNNKSSNIFAKKQLNVDFINNKTNFNSKSNKYITNNYTIKNKDIFLRNSNILSLKDKLFKKHSSYDPKIFRTLYLGTQIILPSNQLI